MTELRIGMSVTMNRDGSVWIRDSEGNERTHAPFSDEARAYRALAGGDEVIGVASQVPAVNTPRNPWTVIGIDRINRVVTIG